MPTPEARRARLGHLYELLAGPGTLEEFVDQLAVMATEQMDRPLWCGLTVRAEGQPVTLASSDEHATALDQAQYDADQGPCLEAISGGKPVEVNDPAEFVRWPVWQRVAAEHGVKTLLSVPLITTGTPQGALNLYSTSKTHFTGTERSAAADFAHHVAGTIMVATRIAELAELTSNLEAALTSRAVIDQAKGILMSQEHCGPDEAFAMLRTGSQNRNIKVRDLAVEIVTRASKDTPHRTIRA